MSRGAGRRCGPEYRLVVFVERSDERAEDEDELVVVRVQPSSDRRAGLVRALADLLMADLERRRRGDDESSDLRAAVDG